MKKVLTVLTLLFITVNTYSQEHSTKNNTEDTTCKCKKISNTPVTVAAHYPEGKAAFNEAFLNEFKIPNLPEGTKELTFTVQFNVETDGSLTNFTLTNCMNDIAGKQAITILQKMKWTPAMQGEKVIKSLHRLPFTINVPK
ncbi:hypothetical protein AV926_10680 [Myroides marinus]|uniref:TonB C-terminal domain-containing protein n=1 Tax=Myroides marinus TaxID=703342 RepID=A0A161SFR9_9FLAO|nr:hypothetical protein [Myroides marinus]KZE79915.1 hypothetical protein AV926_10680 [Myroides marinus]